MGIRGFRFVWHGEWSDPEVVWHGRAMNMYSIEEPMWADFCEAADENGWEPTEENFEKFCRKETWRLREYAQAVIDRGCAYRVEGLRLVYRAFSATPGFSYVPTP